MFTHVIQPVIQLFFLAAKPLDKKEVYNQSSLSNTTVYVGMLPVNITGM